MTTACLDCDNNLLTVRDSLYKALEQLTWSLF